MIIRRVSLRLLFFITTLILHCSLHVRFQSFTPQQFLIVRSADVGLFAMFNGVLGLLECYESGGCAGVKVDLVDRGLYYDALSGPNWWEYYFEPLSVGSQKENVVVLEGWSGWYKITPYALRTVEYMVRETGYNLIRKYIKLKPFIQNEINSFIKKNFEDSFIIGVHYRGTDKAEELQTNCLLDYDVVYQETLKSINSLENPNYKIFIATDEQRFLNFMESKFGNKIIYVAQPRSLDGKSLHKNPLDDFQYSKFRLGAECVIDAVLLSHTHTLIKTASNLSTASTLFNPSIPFLQLNKHKWAIG